MRKLLIVLILIGAGSISCSQEKNEAENSGCSEISRQASEKLSDYLYKTKDKKRLVESLSLYDSAISCDPLNSINYQSKITILGLLKRFKEIVIVQEKLFQLSKESDAKVLVAKGLMYEKLGLYDSSRNEFERALHVYNSQLEANSFDSLRIICERIYLIAITHGKDSALKTFEPYLKEYPTNSDVKMYGLIFRDFDRKTIIPE